MSLSRRLLLLTPAALFGQSSGNKPPVHHPILAPLWEFVKKNAKHLLPMMSALEFAQTLLRRERPRLQIVYNNNLRETEAGYGEAFFEVDPKLNFVVVKVLAENGVLLKSPKAVARPAVTLYQVENDVVTLKMRGDYMPPGATQPIGIVLYEITLALKPGGISEGVMLHFTQIGRAHV